jgi:hypothetical protein
MDMQVSEHRRYKYKQQVVIFEHTRIPGSDFFTHGLLKGFLGHIAKELP